MVGTEMFIWGGYGKFSALHSIVIICDPDRAASGGHRQRRAFYNDLHVLQTAPHVPVEEDGETQESHQEGDMVWKKIITGGANPEPRSDHSTSLIGIYPPPDWYPWQRNTHTARVTLPPLPLPPLPANHLDPASFSPTLMLPSRARSQRSLQAPTTGCCASWADVITSSTSPMCTFST